MYMIHRSIKIMYMIHRSIKIMYMIHRSIKIMYMIHRSIKIMYMIHRSIKIMYTIHRRNGYLHYKSLCHVMKNVNKHIFYVEPILKVICCLASANVVLCNYTGIQVTTQPTAPNDTSLQAVELSQWTQAAVQIVSNLPAPSNEGPIYRFFGHADPLDGWRCCSQKRVMSRPIQVRQL